MKYLCIDRYYLVTQAIARIDTFKQDMNSNSDAFLHNKVWHKVWESGLSEYSMGEVIGLELGLRRAVDRKAGAYASNS